MQAAPGRESPFRHLISEHLGTDALSCPVVGRTFQGIEHVNVQGALEQYVAGQGRSWGLLGVTAQNERFMQNALYDLLAAERGAAMSQVGPVEYTELLGRDQGPVSNGRGASSSTVPSAWPSSSEPGSVRR